MSPSLPNHAFHLCISVAAGICEGLDHHADRQPKLCQPVNLAPPRCENLGRAVVRPEDHLYSRASVAKLASPIGSSHSGAIVS